MNNLAMVIFFSEGFPGEPVVSAIQVLASRPSQIDAR